MSKLDIAAENFIRSMEGREYPLCFSKKEFESWSMLEDESKTKPVRKFVCRDCTLPFQARMVSENRCINPKLNVIDL